MLIPGALAQVSRDSELKIAELGLTKDGNETGDAIRERHARVGLARGGMIVLFEGFGQFNIQAGDVAINVLPSCLFRVEVDQNRTRVTCVRGKLVAAPKGGQSVPIGAGSFREWPSERGVMSAAADERTQKDVLATLQAARELQELDSAHRDRLPSN